MIELIVVVGLTLIGMNALLIVINNMDDGGDE